MTERETEQTGPQITYADKEGLYRTLSDLQTYILIAEEQLPYPGAAVAIFALPGLQFAASIHLQAQKRLGKTIRGIADQFPRADYDEDEEDFVALHISEYTAFEVSRDDAENAVIIATEGYPKSPLDDITWKKFEVITSDLTELLVRSLMEVYKYEEALISHTNITIYSNDITGRNDPDTESYPYNSGSISEY